MEKTNVFYRKRRFSNVYKNSFIAPIDLKFCILALPFNGESKSEVYCLLGSTLNFDIGKPTSRILTCLSNQYSIYSKLFPFPKILVINIKIKSLSLIKKHVFKSRRYWNVLLKKHCRSVSDIILNQQC